MCPALLPATLGGGSGSGFPIVSFRKASGLCGSKANLQETRAAVLRAVHEPHLVFPLPEGPASSRARALREQPLRTTNERAWSCWPA